MTITGNYFAAGATVTIGGVAATKVIIVSATSITCTTPAHAAAGAVNVVVANPTGVSGTLTGGFTY
ncbi:MAG: IPT/TIG domain-containing protein [Candidatus Sulfotelmatobacter sp.]